MGQQMKLKFFYSLTIGLLFILSVSQLSAGYNPVIDDQPENLMPNYYDFSQGRVDSFVVFPETRKDYNELMKLDGVIRGFPTLRVVLIETSIRNAENLAVFGPVSLTSEIPALYSENPVLIGGPKGVGLESLEDAPIMDVDKLWNLGYSGQGVKVGIVDDGFEDHNGLVGRLENLTWFDEGPDGSRSPRHGIWVAGTIAGTGDVDPLAVGNAPNSTFYMAGFKTIETPDGPGFAVGPNAVNYFAAFEYMANLNDSIEVVNFSGGGLYWYGVDIITQRLEESNVLLVASAGNSGPNAGTLGCPACAIPALAVGATQRNTRNDIASFSSRGPGAIPGMKPDVVAPGVDVYTTGKGDVYERVSGTSFSSPLTAGAIATMISALRANNISYNIGSLKASVIEGAFQGDGKNGDYTKGAGMVNIYNSYQYLLQNSADNGFANALVLTPKNTGMFGFRTLSGITTTLEGITVITSNITDVTFTLSGELATYLTLVNSTWDSGYSKAVPLAIDTNGMEARTYSGVLTATLGDLVSNVTISVNIIGEAKGKVAMDLRHTDWDISGSDTLKGSNTGVMVSHMISQGYWVEEVHTEITSTLLNDYDVLWMPDPFNKAFFEGEDLTASEMTAILDYVDNGGSVFIDFNGPFTDSNSGIQSGVDPDKINALISNWGINSSTDPSLGNIATQTLPANNISSLTKGVPDITQAGNWLFMDRAKAEAKNAYLSAITGDDSKSNLIAYDQRGGGRVIVTSTNFWMDNFGGLNKYKATGDKQLSINTINWLTAKQRLQVVSESLVDGRLKTTVKSPTAPTAMRVGNENIDGKQIDVTDNGDGTYSIDYQANQDGIHAIQIYNGEEYYRKDIVLDLEGPSITPDLENNTVFGEDETIGFVRFQVVDTLYKVKFNDIVVKYNGEVVDPTVFRTFFFGTELKVSLPLETLTGEGPHILTVEATDNQGHTTVYDWWFWIGTGPVTSEPINTTTSVTTESTETGAPFAIVASLTGIFGIVIIFRRKIKS